MVLVFIIFIGICLGSFVNALVWRLREQRMLAETVDGKKLNRKQQQRLNELSISRGRSMCPNCGHTLHAKDLVPLGSWLVLGGKCRYCKTPISAQYPLVELLGGSLFALSYLAWPFALHGVGLGLLITWLVSLVLMLALAVYDARWFELPTVLILPLAGLAAVFAVLRLSLAPSFASAAFMMVSAMALLGGLFWLLHTLSKGTWIGYGDVRLAIPLALLAGSPVGVCQLLFVASFAGTLVAAPQLIRREKHMKTTLPFGPYLLLGCIVVVLYGADITQWLNTSLLTI